jgi:hypothetical protein
MGTEEALRRVKLIAPMLRRDVETAILSHAVMEAANDTIPKGMAGTYSDFVDTYSAVQNSLSLKLAMDLARIFDLSEGGRSHPPEKQDKASIQVLGALLRRPDVQNRLEEEAAQWFPGSAHFATVGSAHPQVVEAMLDEDYRSQNRHDCRKAIAAFLALAGRLEVEGSEEKDALRRTRDFRHSRLAHALFDKEPKAPKYADLNLLLDLAKGVATSASLAVEGLSNDLGDQARRARQNAEGYAACVLDGLQRAPHNR